MHVASFDDFLTLLEKESTGNRTAGLCHSDAVIKAHQTVKIQIGETLYHQYNGQLLVESDELMVKLGFETFK